MTVLKGIKKREQRIVTRIEKKNPVKKEKLETFRPWTCKKWKRLNYNKR
jgi:hypothetical protein